MAFKWNKEEAIQIKESMAPLDLIIASDIIYLAAYFQNLIDTFMYLSSPQTRIYLCSTDHGNVKDFYKLLDTHSNILTYEILS